MREAGKEICKKIIQYNLAKLPSRYQTQGSKKKKKLKGFTINGFSQTCINHQKIHIMTQPTRLACNCREWLYRNCIKKLLTTANIKRTLNLKIIGQGLERLAP